MRQELIDSITKNLRRVHSEGGVFTEWTEDREKFVGEVVELIKASYSMGFEDAIELGMHALTELGETE